MVALYWAVIWVHVNRNTWSVMSALSFWIYVSLSTYYAFNVLSLWACINSRCGCLTLEPILTHNIYIRTSCWFSATRCIRQIPNILLARSFKHTHTQLPLFHPPTYLSHPTASSRIRLDWASGDIRLLRPWGDLATKHDHRCSDPSDLHQRECSAKHGARCQPMGVCDRLCRWAKGKGASAGKSVCCFGAHPISASQWAD